MNDEQNKTATAKGKLAGEDVAERLRDLVGQGLSLADIRLKLGIAVSRQALHRRIGNLGLVLTREPFGATKPNPELGRRLTGAEMVKYRRPRRARDRAWLDSFSSELDALLVGNQMTYAEIWDELLRRHPFVPQLASQTSSRDKSLRIAVWVSRQRTKYRRGLKA